MKIKIILVEFWSHNTINPHGILTVELPEIYELSLSESMLIPRMGIASIKHLISFFESYFILWNKTIQKKHFRVTEVKQTERIPLFVENSSISNAGLWKMRRDKSWVLLALLAYLSFYESRVLEVCCNCFNSFCSWFLFG